MNWTKAIARKRRELLAVVRWLIALLAAGATRGEVLWIIRPAEAAVRRLVVLVMRHAIKQLAGAQRAADKIGKHLPDFSAFKRDPNRAPRFCLSDPRLCLEACAPAAKSGGPRIWVLGMAEATASRPVRATPRTDTTARRLEVLRHALDHLPREARRMARLIERRAMRGIAGSTGGLLRPGLPPGTRKRRHAVHEILADCQGLVTGGVWRPPRHRDEGWHVEPF